MAADGSIIIDVSVDDKQAEKDLNRLNSRIKSLEEQAESRNQGRLPLEENFSKLNAELEEARKQLAMLENESYAIDAAMQPGSSVEDFVAAQADQKRVNDRLQQHREQVSSIEKEWQKAVNELKKYDSKTESISRNLENAKEDAGALQRYLANAGSSSDKMARATEKASKSSSMFATRMKGIVASAFVFNIISAGLRQFTQWLGKAIKTNDEASAAIAKLKGALLTLAQPLVEVIIPAFTTFINALTRIVSMISNLVSSLFGSTQKESAEAAEGLYNEMEALDGVGSAAKKAGKSLASFDEINKLSDNSSAGGGGTGDGGTAPDFTGPIRDSLNGIVELFTGVALLALGAILTFSGAHIVVGLGLMAIGALAIYDAVSTNWGGIVELLQGPIGAIVAILGTALLVIGAILVFSGANIPLGIGLMIAGAAGLATAATANWDYIVEALQGPIGAVTAIVSAAVLVLGAVITFTGANLPLGIGLMVAGAAGLATTVLVNWETIRDALQGPIGEITAIVSTALLVLGAILTFTGANLPLGIGLMAAGAIGLAAVAVLNWDKIVTALQGTIGKITAIVSAALLVLGIILCATGVGIPLGIALIAAGAIGLVTVAALNWDAILDKLKEVWGKIKSWWETNVAKYFTADFWANLAKDMINGFIGKLEDGINWVLSGIGSMANGIINTLNKIPGVDIEEVDWGHVEIPRLAKGAVIPPNREFLAVLGDQKSGTNIEAPADLIRQIVRSELQNSGFSGGEQTVILEVDKVQFGKVIYKLNRAESRRIGVNLVGV